MDDRLLTEQEVDAIKERYPIGTKIRLIHMDNDLHPIEGGTIGIVSEIDDQGQLHMKWENGRGLALIPNIDTFEVLERPDTEDMFFTTVMY